VTAASIGIGYSFSQDLQLNATFFHAFYDSLTTPPTRPFPGTYEHAGEHRHGGHRLAHGRAAARQFQPRAHAPGALAQAEGVSAPMRRGRAPAFAHELAEVREAGCALPGGYSSGFTSG